MAFDINAVTLVGRLVRDPELSYTAGNKPVCKMSIANNRGSNPDDVNFFDVVAWEKTAEACGNNLKKGSQIIVEGRLKMDKWTDKTSGQSRTKVNIVANVVQFIGGKKDDAQPEPKTTASKPKREINDVTDFGEEMTGDPFEDEQEVPF